MKKSQKISSSLWGGLAQIQHVFDVLICYGFKKLSDVDQKEIPKDTFFLKKYIYKASWFLGDTGKSYYSKYEQLKKER